MVVYFAAVLYMYLYTHVLFWCKENEHFAKQYWEVTVLNIHFVLELQTNNLKTLFLEVLKFAPDFRIIHYLDGAAVAPNLMSQQPRRLRSAQLPTPRWRAAPNWLRTCRKQYYATPRCPHIFCAQAQFDILMTKRTLCAFISPFVCVFCCLQWASSVNPRFLSDL